MGLVCQGTRGEGKIGVVEKAGNRDGWVRQSKERRKRGKECELED